MIEPLGLLHGTDARHALDGGVAFPCPGGAFTLARVGGRVLPVAALTGAARAAALALARVPGWAGLPERALVMGIVNVTPDSFSGGGRHPGAGRVPEAGRVIEAALALVAAGADILDVGGESTRPGAVSVTPEEEQARVLPVIRGLVAALHGQVPVSVDTRNAATMAAALDAGAGIVNDVSGLAHDPRAAGLVAARNCPVVLMHMRGTPDTMGTLARYDDVVADVAAELGSRLAVAEAAGVVRTQVALDPGIGFAKRPADNPVLLRGLPLLLGLGCRVLVGVSRKRFVGELSGVAEPQARMAGSVAAGLFALSRGASILRVHDVAATVQAVRVWEALQG
ncbi:MAG: dihydropteroate synthase [Janthinobacterium lividum]